jgi:hypothetical protein
VDVGKVTDVEFVGAEVQITLQVNEENKSRITDHSRATIGSLSLHDQWSAPASASPPRDRAELPGHPQELLGKRGI